MEREKLTVMEAACLRASFHPVAFRDSAVPPGAIVSFPGCQKTHGFLSFAWCRFIATLRFHH